MSISASLVKKLRDQTGAGMMNCKKALSENDGDFEAAVDWLRTKGLSIAAKKGERVASEGLVSAFVEGNQAVVVEINAETDFLSRNKDFQDVVAVITKQAINTSNIEELQNAQTTDGKSVSDLIVNSIATIGENINLRRMAKISVEQGVIASYVHNSSAENMGKIAVLVALSSASANKDKLQDAAKKIAMHIAATNPSSITIEELDPALVQREREIFFEQSQGSGKPQEIIEKMVEGRIRKFYEEVVLMEQVLVMDGKTKIKDVIAGLAQEVGSEVKLAGVVYFGLGEGIEKEASDFAADVEALTKK